jgi:O-antigen/teichoic acid export membrane protein
MKRIIKTINSPTLLVLFDQFMYSGSNFLITVILARVLSMTEFGLFSSIIIYTYLLLSILSAFLIQPFQIAYPKTENKHEYVQFILYSVLSSFLLISVVNILIYLFLPIKSFSFLTLTFFFITYIFQDLLRKTLLTKNVINSVVYMDAFFLCSIAICYFILNTNINLNVALLIISFSNLLSIGFGILPLIKTFRKTINWKIYLKSHMLQGKWFVSVSLLQWGNSNLIILFSGIYIGLEGIGALRLVQSFFGILNVLLQVVENYFLPKIAKLYHENRQTAKQYLFKITLNGLLLFGSILLLLFMFPNKAITLAGGIQYVKYGFLVQFMAVLYLIIFLGYPIRIMIRIKLLNKSFFIGYLCAFVFTLLSFQWLLVNYSISGAVLGLIFNQLIMLLYWQFQLKKNHFILWK